RDGRVGGSRVKGPRFGRGGDRRSGLAARSYGWLQMNGRRLGSLGAFDGGSSVESLMVPRVEPDDRLRDRSLGQRNRVVGAWPVEAGGKQFVADARDPEVGDLERSFRGEQEVARLDIAVASQPLSDRVFHAQAELDAEPKGLRQVNPGRPDPAF